MIYVVVKTIDRTIGKVSITPSSRMTENAPQRGSLDYARCSIKLTSRSQVGSDASLEVAMVDVRRVVIVFIALGVSMHALPSELAADAV